MKKENYKRILCTERIFQYFNIDYRYDQSVNECHWVQLACINSDINV